MCLYKEKIGAGAKRASRGVGMGQQGEPVTFLKYNASPFSVLGERMMKE